MSVTQKLVTAEELYEMPDRPGIMLELFDGEVVEVTGAGFNHGHIAGLLYRLLAQHVEQEDLGTVASDGTAYVIRRDPDSVRIPDVSFIAWGGEPDEADAYRFVEGAPTIAVEVVSPDDLAYDLRDKIRDYLQAGTHQVWVLWPTSRYVSVHCHNGDTRELGPNGTLDGGDVLPGFSVQVADLFTVE